MEVIKKRKAIDLKEQTFKILSFKAVEKGLNLKALIEQMLDEIAEKEEEKEIYSFLVNNDPDGQIYLNKEEQEAFEKEMGL